MISTPSSAPGIPRVAKDVDDVSIRARIVHVVPDLLVLMAFAVAALAFFYRALVLDDASIPFDLNIWHYPQLALLGEALLHGGFPMWNPREYGGMPFLEPSPEAFYPVNLAILGLGGRLIGWIPYRLIEFELALHYPIAGFNAYCLARGLRVRRLSAVLAGLAYMLGPLLVSQTEHEGLIVGAAWVPLVLLTAKWTIERHGLVWPTLLAVVLGLHLLSGFVPASLSLAVVLLVVFAWAAIRAALREGPPSAHVAGILGRGLWAAGLSVALAAVQILPFLEIDRVSIATNRDLGFGPSLSGLTTLLVPNFFNVHNAADYWGAPDFTQIHYYVPPLVLLLASLALMGSRRWQAGWLVLGAALALLMATEAVRPLQGLLERIPRGMRGGFEMYTFRIFTDLGLALAAGLGFDALLQLRNRGLWSLSWTASTTVASCVVVLIGFAIGGMTWRLIAVTPRDVENATALLQGTAMALVVWLITVAVLVALLRLRRAGSRDWPLGLGAVALVLLPSFVFGANQPFNTSDATSQYEVSPSELFGGRTQVISFLQTQRDQLEPFRLDNSGATAAEWATEAMLWGLDNANGANPVLPSDTATFREAMSQDGPTGHPQRTFQRVRLASPLLNLLNVRYVVASGADGSGTGIQRLDPAAPPGQFQLVFSDFYHVFENRTVLPRALVIPHARVVGSRSEILDLLASGQVDPRAEILLEQPPQVVYQANSTEPSGQGSVTYQPVGFNQVGIYVEDSPGGFLLVLDPYWPDWVATVDGMPAEIVRADYLFRAIALPPGTHDVVMSYEPKSVQYGLIITAFASALVLGILLQSVGRSRSRRNREIEMAINTRAAHALHSVDYQHRSQWDGVLGLSRHRGVWGPLAFLSVLAVYASLEVQDLRLPGLYYDELIQVVPALDVVRGGLWSSVNWIPSAEVSVFGHTLPLMTMDYMGSLKTFVFIPIVAAVGVSPESVRITTVLIGALSLLATFAFVRRLVGLPLALITVGLLATDLSFVYYMRVDYGPTALMMLLKTVALWQLAVWWQTGRISGLIIGALALGLGVYNKADFVWIVFGMIGAAVLVAPRGIRARATLRAGACATGAFVLGAAPLIYFNFKWPMPTLAAVFGPATAGGRSAGFAGQFLERVGVLEHLLDGGHISGGATAISPTSGLVVLLVIASAALALVGTTPHLRTRGWRVTLFALVATCLILVAAAATPGGFAGHHVILSYPFPHLLAAGGMFNLVQWARPRFGTRLVVGTATAISVIAAGQSWLTADGYLGILRSTGGTGNFSDAIYALADVLERQGSDAPVVDLDWGFHFPLVGLSQGSIHSVEATDGSTAQLSQFLADPRVQYVAHAPGTTNFPRGFQAFTAAAKAAGLQVVREQRFATRDGTSVIDLYAARSAARSADMGSEVRTTTLSTASVRQPSHADSPRQVASAEH